MAKRSLPKTLIYEKNNKISGGIYNKMQVDFAYNSNHIEGSRLTHEQTRYIFETKTVDGAANVSDVFEAANHFRCFDLIVESIGSPLTEDFIKKLHGRLKSGVAEDDESVIGEYKKYPNTVGNITTASPDSVKKEMRLLLERKTEKFDLYDIAEFHAEFERIHPFYDGNGRIGRLLVLKMCLENDIIPFYIDDNIKLFYYKGLKEWQTEGENQRLIDVFLTAQDDMKSVLDYFEIEYDKSEITSGQLIEKHKEKTD